MVIVFRNGALAYSEYGFINQPGPIKMSLYYTHDDHFIKNCLLNFSSAYFYTERVCHSSDMSIQIM